MSGYILTRWREPREHAAKTPRGNGGVVAKPEGAIGALCLSDENGSRFATRRTEGKHSTSRAETLIKLLVGA